MKNINPLGLFDEYFLLERLTKLKDLLVKLDDFIDWNNFATYAGQNVLVLCDIEGAERELLDPEQAPDLRGMDIILESHECLIPGITQEIVRRFQDSHAITVVQDNGQRQLINTPPWFNNLAHLDQLLAA